jgi:hypothetical protein
MNPAKSLLLFGVDADAWAAAPCEQCGRVLTTTISFASNSLRGLIASK